jgi:molybdopterin molybdotransferase
MPEFLELLPPQEALHQLIDALQISANAEEISVLDGLGRVLAGPVIAPHPLPTFLRSTVDGYAVRAADTFGASETLPAYLNQVGEAPMGAAPGFEIGPAQCALIHTGGMLPEGTNAVVMIEYTQTARDREIEIMRAAAPGENVIKVGEDVRAGETVLHAGSRLRAAEIGGLMALGVLRVRAAMKPRVGILSSGDEVIPPEQTLLPGQVRDVNSYSLSALVEEAGGQAVRYGIVPDQADVLYSQARQALSECDMIVITAGSSASTRDLTAQVIDQLGAPGVLVHGVNVRPGKPTILAVSEGKAVIGLPGNPVSALVIAGLFVRPVIEKILGLGCGLTYALRPRVPARLSLNIPSQAGREDWVAVHLVVEADGVRAEPVFGKSNLIFTLARADGLVRIPPDATGLGAGAWVDVYMM